jgi:hypothetical protein
MMIRFLQTALLVPGAAVLLALGASACDGDALVTDSVGTPLGEKSEAIVLANLEAEASLNLVARVEVQPNELLEIYEPAPGLFLVSGAGAPEGPSPIAKDATDTGIRELWSRATNGQPISAELEAALERSERRLVARGGTYTFADPAPTSPEREIKPRQLAAPGMGQPAPASLSSGWCDTDYLASDHGNCLFDVSENAVWTWPRDPDSEVCLDDHRDGAWGHHNNAFYGYSSVCAAEGSQVQFTVSSDEFSGGAWSVPLNTFRWYYIFDPSCNSNPFDDCPSLHAEVTQALNDRFHFRFLVKEL